MRKISVLAPIAFSEHTDRGPRAWRQIVNQHARLRTRTMLRSFFRHFDQSGVDRFVIVCPERDLEGVRQLATEEKAAAEILAESEFFALCGLEGESTLNWMGWQLQQMIKLAFARICPTEYYLSMDSDIVQYRAAGVDDLFRDGKALAGVETTADYDRLYLEQFAAFERSAKVEYYDAAQYILDYRRAEDRAGIYFSETPVLLHRASVTAMLDEIESLHSRKFEELLREYPGWTEYSLYFLFLELTGALEQVHSLGDCNSVLSLDRSVWQPTPYYKTQRFYDRLNFQGSALVREGPFLAIQSWIEPRYWLPPKYRSLEEFYRQVETWLLPPAQSSLPPAGTSLDLDSVHPAAFLRILENVPPGSALFQRAREVLDRSLETGSPVPAAMPSGEPVFLTIGMTTHRDYDGVYFTLQAIRMYHPEILPDVELLVIDNDPAGPCAKALKALENFAPNYRYVPYRSRQGTAVRDLVFREAAGQFVLCIDCHVFFPPGSLASLIEYCRSHPDCPDLLQGPLLSDAFEPLATHFEPKWSHGMYGVWGMDGRGQEIDSEPFEVEMQGLGVFGCRRDRWPGLNPRLVGFGGEEGYLHEKFRRAGGRTLCLPFLRWMHRFERPLGIPYQADWPGRIRNYLLIQQELGRDPAPVIQHYEELLGKAEATEAVRTAQLEMAGPFHYFDALYCINLDRQTERWKDMERRFRKLGIERAVRRFSAAETPLNHHIGCALSHRRILAEARQQELHAVLVFEDDARFSADAAEVLSESLRQLEGRDWQLLYLGGYRSESSLREVPGCPHLRMPGWISCTHAIAYHHSVFDSILREVPDNAVDVALWLRTHQAIDRFYNLTLGAISYLTWPVIATQPIIVPDETRAFED